MLIKVYTIHVCPGKANTVVHASVRPINGEIAPTRAFNSFIKHCVFLQQVDESWCTCAVYFCLKNV